MSHHPTEAYNPVRGEMSLWRAVITQALMDAASNSPKVEARHEKRRATHWLLSNREDFDTVCQYADLDPSHVRARSKEALARNCRWRAEPQAKQPHPVPDAKQLGHYALRSKRPAAMPPLETKSMQLPVSDYAPRTAYA